MTFERVMAMDNFIFSRFVKSWSWTVTNAEVTPLHGWVVNKIESIDFSKLTLIELSCLMQGLKNRHLWNDGNVLLRQTFQKKIGHENLSNTVIDLVKRKQKFD